MSLTKYDIESLIGTYFNKRNANPQPVAFPPPADLTPIADAIRDGLQAVANSIEYAAQIKPEPFPDINQFAEAVLLKIKELDKGGRP